MYEITKDDMQALLMDNYSYHALEILPSMLEWVKTDSLYPIQIEVLDSLKAWNFFNNAPTVPLVSFEVGGVNYMNLFWPMSITPISH